MHSFDMPVGYSDHTDGASASVMAATLGACVIEKHFTLDRMMKGPDHAASLEPDELRLMIRSIRDIKHYLGSPVKKPTNAEKEIMPLIRKSIVLSRPLLKGEKITLDALSMKRPGTGISPSHYKEVLGKRMRRNVSTDYQLTRKDYE